MRAAARRRRFEKEAVPYLGEIYAFAHRLTRNEAAAEDLVQETFLRAFRFFHRYRAGTNVRAWLYKICRNTFINQYHRESSRPPHVEFAAVEDRYERALTESSWIGREDPEKSLWRVLIAEKVDEALNELPDPYRSVVHLVLVKGFTYREAAEILEVPIGTVMSRLHRGRRSLQVRLLEQARDAGITGARQAQAGASE